MRRHALIVVALLLLLPVPHARAADLYMGDSAIYGAGGTVDVRPNVLFIVDNSQFMDQGALGTPYDPAADYAGDYTRNAVYRRISATGGTINYDNANNPFIAASADDADSDGYGDLAAISCGEARDILDQTSYYTGKLQSSGACRGSTGFYYTGNLLNYITNPPPGDPWPSATYVAVGTVIQVTDPGTGYPINYEAMTDGVTTGSEPTWGSDEISDGPVDWKRTGSVMNMVQGALELVVELAREKAKFGLMVFGSNNAGGRLLASADKMAAGDTIADDGMDGAVSYANFLAQVERLDDANEPGVPGVLETANSNQKMNEALWDAQQYFKGQYTTTADRMGQDVAGELALVNDTDTPVDCPDIQPNFVVALTMGAAHTAGAKANTIGDQDAAYNVGDVDDAAKRLYTGDITTDPDTPADPPVTTSIIKLVNDEPGDVNDLTQSALRRAAVYGGGNYYLAQNSSQLAEALLEVMNNIVLNTDTSFVAPVVPTSPENRTYSGERVYLGFFEPNSKKPWYGNLKKFGINTYNQITDRYGNVATIESGEGKGNFTVDAKSYWNDLEDAGQVDVGGAGEVLLGQSSRNIYTYLGNADLNDSSNEFVTTNSGITWDGTLGLNVSTDRDKLINFVHGIDTWDEDGDLDATEKRKWILGDVLHSKPMVANYNQYVFNQTNEGNCNWNDTDPFNQTVVYVGANDGMLHAFRDCDGQELWAFIPPEHLDELKLLPPQLHSQFNPSGAHAYFVDGTPAIYTYDADQDGNIGPGPETSAADTDPSGVTDNGVDDKVILIFGLRRGGDAYYALDVTDPEDPQYLWKVDSATTGFGELGQTWSTPHLGKIKHTDGTVKEKVVAFFGAGYDHQNEDGRFGSTERYSNSDAPVPTDDFGDKVSDRVDDDPAGALEPAPPYVTRARNDADDTVTNGPKGRGVYAIEVVTLDSNGDPDWGNTDGGALVWDFVYGDTSNTYNSKRLKHAIPSDLTVLDTNYDGYVDRIYAGNTGGQVWRFCQYGGGGDGLRPLTTPLIDGWIGKRIFEANGVSASEGGFQTEKGRKFFYRPSVTFEANNVFRLYIGSGDRAHPLNWNVVDRLYNIVDKDQVTFELVTEDDLVDVTDNDLQDNGTTAAEVTSILSSLDTSHGWYIKLNQNSGEKGLAAPLAFNKIAYYTTFAPDTTPPPDQCTPGNLGASRLYAVDYKTGEAALNFANANTANNNDTQSTTGNMRARGEDENVLRREDRTVDLGVGIPSGIVVLMPPSGDTKLLIGCGGGLCKEDPVPGGTIIPIYWQEW